MLIKECICADPIDWHSDEYNGGRMELWLENHSGYPDTSRGSAGSRDVSCSEISQVSF